MQTEKTSYYRKNLFEVAEGQLGYFTSKQAQECGYVKNNHPYHVKSGNWQKCERGIYRFTDYPISEYEDYMIWYLWSRNKQGVPQGVFSHQTALRLYGLSDVNPSKIFITVPKSFRKNREIPPVLILIKENITQTDINNISGIQVTSPLKTILDVIDSGDLAEEIIKQAVNQAINNGLITVTNIKEFPTIKKFVIKNERI